MTEDVMQVTIRETRPDLWVESLSASPVQPAEDELVTITGRIRNNGVSATTRGELPRRPLHRWRVSTTCCG